MSMKNAQWAAIAAERVGLKERSAFYRERFAAVDLARITRPEHFTTLPFSEKDDLRQAYPLGIQAVPDREVVTTARSVVRPAMRRMSPA